MQGNPPLSIVRRVSGGLLLALGLAVFAVRFHHEGPYAFPRGGNLFGGIGSLVVGGVLLWPALPRAGRILAFAAGPVVGFFALYATMAELEETISLYATDSAGRPAELRLWVVDREDGEWVGMPRAKAEEHALDGARLEVLRRGEIRCVVPVLHDDRPTVSAIHAMKVAKYAVARAAAAIGLYRREAGPQTVALRLDPCPPAKPAS